MRPLKPRPLPPSVVTPVTARVTTGYFPVDTPVETPVETPVGPGYGPTDTKR